VAFIEVKARANHQYGYPFNAVTPAKQRKINQVAQSFLTKHRLLEKPTRFDVVSLTTALEGTFRMELLGKFFLVSMIRLMSLKRFFMRIIN
jgi:Holliday junction resolvase-like predicted endonuclease